VGVVHRAIQPATDSPVTTTPGAPRRAVESMWSNWAQSLYNFLLSRTSDRELVSDVSQDALLTALEQVRKGRQVKRAWL
jgi:DNA-directed RNA polymerase specialized sigma24 family protein